MRLSSGEISWTGVDVPGERRVELRRGMLGHEGEYDLARGSERPILGFLPEGHGAAELRPDGGGRGAEAALRTLRMAYVQPERRRQQVLAEQPRGVVDDLARAHGLQHRLRLQLLDGVADGVALDALQVREPLDVLP